MITDPIDQSANEPFFDVSGIIQENIIKTKLTNELQVKPDLVHSAGVWSTKNNASWAVKAQTLKLGPTLFPSPGKNRRIMARIGLRQKEWKSKF